MFARRLHVRLRAPEGSRPCPLKYLDSFAMRSFTGESRFDETLPVADGLMEVSLRVPLEELRAALEDWFRRKSYLKSSETVELQDKEDK
jgi:hypothetical protein